MKTAADFITECCTVLLVPPIMTVFIVAWVFIWASLAMYVFTNRDYSKCKAATPEK